MKLGKALKSTLVGLFTLAATALYLETTGYNHFDGRDGNMICEVDPSCRHMTEGEIRSAQSVFGDEIDYHRVKIFNRPNNVMSALMAVFNVTGAANAPNGNIYYIDSSIYSDDMSTDADKEALFLHEMTHVWQDRHGKLGPRIVIEYLRAEGDYPSLYSYDLDDDTPFRDMGMEQQASLVEDYRALINSYDEGNRWNGWTRLNCERVLKFQEKLRQELPVTPLAACSRPVGPGNA